MAEGDKKQVKPAHTSVLMEPDLKAFLQALARKRSVEEGRTITLSDLIRDAVIKAYQPGQKANSKGVKP